MISIDTTRRSQGEWHALVEQFHDVSIMQLWEYGHVKEQLQGWEVVHHVFSENGTIIGIAQGVVRRLPILRGGMLWMNRGPLWRRRDAKSDAQMLDRLLAAVRDYWTVRGFYLRIAPPLAHDAAACDRLRALGMDIRPAAGWRSSVVDCTRGVDELRSALDKRWRNCLTKAERLGLTYVTGCDGALVRRFERDYTSFLQEKTYATPLTLEFVRALAVALPSERALRVHAATYRGVHCGSIVTAEYHGTAEYLIGAVNASGKQVNAGQFLLWNALCDMQERGMTRFDLGGMHPDQTPKGIYHFKAGISGTPYTLIGECESARGVVPRLTRRLVALMTRVVA